MAHPRQTGRLTWIRHQVDIFRYGIFRVLLALYFVLLCPRRNSFLLEINFFLHWTIVSISTYFIRPLLLIFYLDVSRHSNILTIEESTKLVHFPIRIFYRHHFTEWYQP
jgi:hypothetical protein